MVQGCQQRVSSRLLATETNWPQGPLLETPISSEQERGRRGVEEGMGRERRREESGLRQKGLALLHFYRANEPDEDIRG